MSYEAVLEQVCSVPLITADKGFLKITELDLQLVEPFAD